MIFIVFMRLSASIQERVQEKNILVFYRIFKFSEIWPTTDMNPLDI